MNKDSTKKSSTAFRVLRVGLKILAGLLVVCILAIGGALLWLRTESASTMISNLATKQLSSLGLELRMGPMGGTLPGSLYLRDIVLSDKDGVFFRASSLSFEARLSSLLKGSLEVADLSLEKPEVIRLPALPPSEELEEEEKEESSGGIPALPFTIRIDRLALTGGQIHAAVLAPQAQSQAVYNLDISGAASLEGSTLAARLNMDFLNADGTGLALRLDLDAASGLAGLYAQSPDTQQPRDTQSPGAQSPDTQTAMATPAGEDTLSLSISLRENEQGLLALLLNDPGLPPYVLSLNGKGPVRDWRADLALLLGKDAPVREAAAGAISGKSGTAEILALSSQLGLQCRSGSLWKDLLQQPDFLLSLKNELRAGSKMPESLLPLIGDKLMADVELAGRGATYTASLAAGSNAWRLNVENLSLTPAGQGNGAGPAWADADGNQREKGLAVTGALSAAITDLPALIRPAKDTSPLPLRSLVVTSTLSALADGSFSGIDASGDITAGGVNMSAIAAEGQPSEPTEDFSAAYKITARLTDSRASLDALSLQGLGISIQAKAMTDTATQALEAEATVDAADHARWQDLLGRLAGFAAKDGEAALGGSIALALDLKLDPKPADARNAEASQTAAPQAPASGNLRLNAVNMRWPTAQLANIIGPSITATATLSGGTLTGAPEPYLVELAELKAGIVSAKGKASILLPTPGADGRSADPGSLQAALEAEISDLAPLAMDEKGQAPVSGPLRAEATAEGKLDALSLHLTALSPAITAAGNKLSDIVLKLHADTSQSPSRLAAAGDVALSLGQSPGGPLKLDGRWKVEMPQGQEGNTPPMKAAVESLKLQGAGVELNADVTASLPSGGFPAIQGNVKGAVTDWSRLAALSGAPLSGGPADFTLTLANQGKGQEARLDLSLASLRVQEKNSPPSFAVRDVKALLQASGLPDKLNMDFTLDTGRGRAGPLAWRSGLGSVKGSNNNGDFSLTLQSQSRRGAQGSRATAGNTGKTRKAKASELLVLQGAYDLSKMEVAVNTFALQKSRQKVGLELQKPFMVRLDKGIAVQGLDMVFQPKGKLMADAGIAPGKLNLKLKLEELSFGFFKLFTAATLPDGSLTAEADIESSGGKPKGNLKVRSRVSATQSVSGVTPADSAGGSAIFELLLDAGLTASPGPAAVADSGVRPIPGIIWLSGTGSLGDSSKQASSREGKLLFQIPMRAGSNGLPLPDAAAPMALKLNWNGPIESLWQAVPMADRYLSGNAFLDVSVSGRMNAPKLLLTAYMAGGSFQDIPNGILISGIDLEARNTAQGDVRALLSAKDEQSGSLAVEANLTGVMGVAGVTPTLAIRGQLDQFSPLHRDDLSIYLSGLFGVNGPMDAMEVTSDITVTRGELMLSSKMGGSVTTLDVVNKKRADQEEEEVEEEAVAPAGPKLNIHVRIPRYFFIRGMGVNSEWSGDLRIDGLASAPSLRGSLKPVRGSVDLLSRTFDIGEGSITFTGGMNTNPALDLTLVNEGPNITAYVKVGGSAKKPKLTLESKPPLPNDEVLAMVLFGKRMSELSRFESIQLANSLRELSGVGGSSLDVLTGVRKSTGLDMLRVGGGGSDSQRGSSGQSGESNLGAPKTTDSNGETTPTLEAGKYINDSIYVGVEQGMTQESTAVRVEVELYPSITLQGKSTSESSEVGIGWKKDY